MQTKQKTAYLESMTEQKYRYLQKFVNTENKHTANSLVQIGDYAVILSDNNTTYQGFVSRLGSKNVTIVTISQYGIQDLKFPRTFINSFYGVTDIVKRIQELQSLE